jgi:outer membrane protein
MRVKFSALCVLVFFTIKIYAQQPTGATLTLRQSIETGIANNLDIKQRQLDMQRANINYKQAKGNRLPTLSGNIVHGISSGRSIDRGSNTFVNQQFTSADYGLNTDITVFNGFRLLNAVKQNALAYDASKMELQQAEYELTLNIILAYLQILNNEDQLAQSRNQALLSRTPLERLEVLDKQGAIAPALLYDLRGQLANDELAIVNGENALNAARLALAQLMNVPYDANVKIERLNADQFSMGYEGDVETIYQAAIKDLALVKAAELRKQSAVKGVKAARGSLSPTIYLTGSLGTAYSSTIERNIRTGTFSNDSTNGYVTLGGNKVAVFANNEKIAFEKIGYFNQIRNNYGTFAGVGVRIPILNAFRARNQVSLAKIDLKSAEYAAQATYIQLKQFIEQAYFNMKAAQDRYRVLTEQVNAFTQSFRAAEVRFNAGLGTTVDYLIAKNNLDRANINLVNARYDYVLRTKILDYYQSKPLW